MDHWQRTRAAIEGRPCDRVPLSLWRHFPEDDHDPRRLADRMLAWQRRWEFDLVKFMPSGTYGVEDWGAVSAYRGAPNGAREVTGPGIRGVADWALKRLDVTQGSHGRQNEALASVARELDGSVPILQTVFSPLTTARKLAGERLMTDLRRHPEVLHEALETITDATIRFAQDAIACGAHGVFLATQLASHRILTDAEYAAFGRHYDLRVLRAVRGAGRINMLHAHGVDLMLSLVADYPVEVFNWHDRLTEPGLREAAKSFPGLLAGGLNEGATLVGGSSEATRKEVLDAITQTGGRRLMIAPGCVLRVDTPDEQIEAVVQAVASHSSHF